MKLPSGVYPGATTVLGDGPTPCSWMFVGEAPGYEEDRSGRPFVGVSGRLLNRTLEYYTSLRRGGVRITNIVKHRPPGNRKPLASEVKKYLPFFYEELRECAPEVVVTLGAVAAKAFDKKIRLMSDHGVARWCEVEGWKGLVVPWFHPAFALRSPQAFAALAADAARLGDTVAGAGGIALADNVYSLATEEEVVARLLTTWGTFGFDTETTSPEHGGVFATDEATMVGYSVSWAPGTGVYVPTTAVGDGMAGILGSPLWKKICHNAKFEYKVLAKQGI